MNEGMTSPVFSRDQDELKMRRRRVDACFCVAMFAVLLVVGELFGLGIYFGNGNIAARQREGERGRGDGWYAVHVFLPAPLVLMLMLCCYLVDACYSPSCGAGNQVGWEGRSAATGIGSSREAGGHTAWSRWPSQLFGGEEDTPILPPDSLPPGASRGFGAFEIDSTAPTVDL